MLRLTVVIEEGFDERTSEFVESETVVIELEHSLVSLSKWESKWEVNFLGNENKTSEQIQDYIRMMILGDIPVDNVLSHLTPDQLIQINDYIDAKMTATKIYEEPARPGNHETITAEIIYYWMISFGIPIEWETRHLGRLLTLIKVCSIKNTPPEKRRTRQSSEDRRALNEQRKKETGSKG